MGKLEGRIAVITGGSQGIGEYIVKAYAKEGAKICLNYVSDSSTALAEAIAEEIKGDGGEIFCYQADVRNPEQIRAMMKETADRFGGIDILVNNAGLNLEGRIIDMEYERIKLMLDVDLFGDFVAIKEALPYLLKSKYPRIINNASQLAQKGADTMSVYSAAKAGVLGMTRSLAREFSKQGMDTKILINTVAPGAVTVGQSKTVSQEYVRWLESTLPLGRMVTPEEVPPCFVFLASDECTGFIGQTLCPNSGDTMVY